MKIHLQAGNSFVINDTTGEGTLAGEGKLLVTGTFMNSSTAGITVSKPIELGDVNDNGDVIDWYVPINR